MSERRAIVVFTEGDLEEACTRPTLAEARAMADGIVIGAGYYGAGTCQAFVLPDDAEQMIKEIDAGDLMRATEAAADKWHAAAWAALGASPLADGTYELIGPHFNGNPEGLTVDCFRRHGDAVIDVDRTFDGLRDYLAAHEVEGIVFAHPDGRMCKIRRNDFGLAWGAKRSATAQ